MLRLVKIQYGLTKTCHYDWKRQPRGSGGWGKWNDIQNLLHQLQWNGSGNEMKFNGLGKYNNTYTPNTSSN